MTRKTFYVYASMLQDAPVKPGTLKQEPQVVAGPFTRADAEASAARLRQAEPQPAIFAYFVQDDDGTSGDICGYEPAVNDEDTI